MSASVICVDLSSESDEESPAKRRRLEDPRRVLPPSGRQSLPAKLLNIPKASLGSAMIVPVAETGPARETPVIVDPLRSMHIPSGITVTKHQKNVLATNGNLTISLAESSSNNNNNNTTSFNNNVTPKQINVGTGQKVAWSVSSKAPSPNAVITTVPSHQVRVTPFNPIRLAPGSKIIPASKAMPAKIQPILGMGQSPQQAQAQQPKAIILGFTKPNTAVGQTAQHQKPLSLQIHQKLVAGQQKVMASVSQINQLPLQQQQPLRPVSIQLQQQQIQRNGPLPTQQQKPLGCPVPTQQEKLPRGPLPTKPDEPLGGPLPTEPDEILRGPLPTELDVPLVGPLPTRPKPPVRSIQQPVKKNTAIGVQIPQTQEPLGGTLPTRPKPLGGQLLTQQKPPVGSLQQPVKQNTGIGVQIQQSQQPLGGPLPTRPKALGGQLLTQQKPPVGSLQQPVKQNTGIGVQIQQIPKVFVGQQPQKEYLSKLQQEQQKILLGHLQQPQQKTFLGQLQQEQQKKILGQSQQQKEPLGQPQPQQKPPQQLNNSLVHLQQQQQHKTSVGQLQQQQQNQPQQHSMVHLKHQQQQQQKKTSLGQLQQQPQQQQKKISAGQLQQQPQQQLSTSAVQLQQQQKLQKASLGQQSAAQKQGAAPGQQQKLPVGQSQPQKRKSAGLLQQQQVKKIVMQPHLPKTSVVLPRPQQLPNPLLVAQQQSPKTQMAIQLLNSVMGPQFPPQQPLLPVVNQITHKSMTIQRLPMLQTPPTVQKILPKQIAPQQTPPPAHILQKQTMPNAAMQNPPFAHRPPIVRPMTVAKITPVPTNNNVCIPMKPQMARAVSPPRDATMTAARTLPFKRSQRKASAAPMTSTHVQGFTASATPPQRLLATPPHCAAALNEPLLLNLPPTTSITPQLTPTTTPPPVGPSAAVQQQQLDKAAAIKLNSLPGASISPVNRAQTASAKRIQPITVLKKSDEEWRKHLEQQQQKKHVQLQSSSMTTIVLVESPPTTPPTDKPEPEPERGPMTVEKSSKQPMPTDKQSGAIKRPAVMISRKKSGSVVTEIVDLDNIPDIPLQKRRKECFPPIKNAIKAAPSVNAPFTTEYAALLRLCREVDKSADMERLVKGELTQYYYSAPESFVMSCGFRNLVTTAMAMIQNESYLVYVHLKYVLDELASRRLTKIFPTVRAIPPASQFPLPPTSFTPKQPAMLNAPEQQTVMAGREQDDESEEVTLVNVQTISSEDRRRNERIRHFYRTLHAITKRIKMLEEAEVDLNDEDSSYLQLERFKKRACQIYEKICDLKGESKSVRRQLKKPIHFKDSDYPHFNNSLSAFVNRMQDFPDYHDVLQILEQCNKEKELGLAKYEMKRIAYDAFNKVGRMLQSRRKNDLYETVTHYTANGKDPASSDPELLAKLKENNKKQTKISDILEKYALEQDLNAEERQEARLKEKKLKQVKADEEAAKLAALAEDDDKPCTSAQAAAKAAALAALKRGPAARGNVIRKKRSANGRILKIYDDEDDSEEESDSEDDDVEEFVNNFQANSDVSDADSEVEAVTSPKRDALPLAEEEDVIDITRDETGKKNDEATPNGRLKIMSVSSLNANFVHGQDLYRKPNPMPSAKPVIADQIIISDEES
ncbi:titin isoform X1 [Drosophila mauritiana]|uniref:Titin isoform X1 n=1 Tax=Drosophila mauritiana TaxID=7226 RepID=A0A6P8KXI4_DROMA|nr:titin isoform X1 [Drosophila mauritiana]